MLVDDVLTPRDFSLFPPVAAAYIGIAVAGGLLSFVDDYLCAWVGERFVLNLRTSLFAHLHRMSLGFFERRQLGDLMSRISSDVNAIEQLVLSGRHAGARATAFKILFFGGLLFYLELAARARLADRRAAVRAGVALLLHAHQGGVPGEAAPVRARSRPSPRRA